MTLLVAWSGADSHGPASVYIAADSRISWGKHVTFDYGRKVFTFKTYPDIVGYCGAVLFPSMAISQIIELADNGLLLTRTMSCKERFECFKEKLVQQLRRYPSENKITGGLFQVMYAARELPDHRRFFCHLIEWRKPKWRGKEILLKNASTVLAALGSGATHFQRNYDRYETGPNKSTSRAVFHCFCETLFSNADPLFGGAPQLVGIYCKPNSPAFQYGIVRDGKRYMCGAEIDRLPDYDSVEWRNDLFERCDGRTMRLLKGAQPQPNPLRTL
jgi:hypothetical protein